MDGIDRSLALSRSFGDFEFKQNQNVGPEMQVITCKPEVMVWKRSKDDDFLLIASDGVVRVFLCFHV